jgi:hypothetical protein
MSFDGMDVDQLRDLAAQINADAQKLSGLVASMTGVVAQVTLFWHGPMVAVFEQDWAVTYRPSLLAASDTLTALHAHLVSNIGQQTSASAADGGWSAERVVGDFENFLTGEGLVDFPVSAIPDASQAGKFLADSHIGTLMDGLGFIGMGIGVYQTGHEMFDTGEELAQGNYVAAANDFTDGVADGLQTYPSPVTFAAGTVLKLADQVANLDWKDTPSPFSGSNFQQYYVPEIQSMGTGAYWEQAGSVLWGDM